MSHALAFGAGVCLGVGALVWLSLWADSRNQRFYQAVEAREWQG